MGAELGPSRSGGEGMRSFTVCPRRQTFTKATKWRTKRKMHAWCGGRGAGSRDGDTDSSARGQRPLAGTRTFGCHKINWNFLSSYQLTEGVLFLGVTYSANLPHICELQVTSLQNMSVPRLWGKERQSLILYPIKPRKLCMNVYSGMQKSAQ
jgi:hypothetical protein